MKTEQERRPVRYTFRLTEAEDAMIRKKAEACGVTNLSTLFRAMVLNGYVLKLDLPEIRELLRLMKNLTNNVNQMAKRLNENGNVYETEMDDILRRLDDVWDAVNQVLVKLALKQNEEAVL